MGYFLTLLIVFVGLVRDIQAAENAAVPPTTYVDEGACPFECCHYGKWKVHSATWLFAKPDKSSRKILQIPAGKKVIAVTGKVITTKPGAVDVVRPFVDEYSHIHYTPGDRIAVYTYLGEGFFKIWHNGTFHEAEIPFILHGHGGFVKCAEEQTCWGRGTLPESEWWIQLKTQSGSIGWTNQPENFGNKDACE